MDIQNIHLMNLTNTLIDNSRALLPSITQRIDNVAVSPDYVFLIEKTSKVTRISGRPLGDELEVPVIVARNNKGRVESINWEQYKALRYRYRVRIDVVSEYRNQLIELGLDVSSLTQSETH